MTDDPHEDVRARLAAEPSPSMPDDVAARLHGALAAEARSRQKSATGGPEDATTPATVTELPRRRGRWKTPLLAAAGVVAVVAIGIPVINQTSNQSGDDAGSADSSSGAIQSDSSRESPESASPDYSDQAEPQTRTHDMVEKFRQAPMALHRTTFQSDVSSYLGDSARSSAPSALKGDVGAVVSCKGGRPSAPGGLRAALDGDPAVVLITPATDGVRARAVVCSAAGPTVAAQALLD